MSAEKVTPMAHHLEESFLIPRSKRHGALADPLSTAEAGTPSSSPGHARSLAGLVRERLPSIEQRLRFGWYRHHLAAELAEALGRPVQLEAFKKALWRARKAARLQPPSGCMQNVSEPVLVSPEPIAETKARLAPHSAKPSRSVLPTRHSLSRPAGFDMQALQGKSADDLV